MAQDELLLGIHSKTLAKSVTLSGPDLPEADAMVRYEGCAAMATQPVYHSSSVVDANSIQRRSHSRESSGASVKFSQCAAGSPRVTVLPSCDDPRAKRYPRHHLTSEDTDSCDSLQLPDRLSPDSVDAAGSHPLHTGMLHGDSKSQNSDYGSFCNTPSDTFVPVRSRMNCSTLPADHSDDPIYQVSNVENSRHRGHQRNDSEVPMPNDASRPLLENHDSSSDEDGISSRSFPRRKNRHKAPTEGDGVNIDMPPDASEGAGHAGLNQDEESDDEESDEIPSEPIKTLLAFVFLIFAWVATTTSLALTHERLPDYKPLPDLFLDNVQYQPWGLNASEILIMVSIWTAFLFTLFHRYRFIVLRRIFILVGIHYYYRAVTMYITVLPKPNENYICEPKSNETTAGDIAIRVLKLLSGMGLSINGKHVYCGDYIYSGHTMTLIVAYFVIKEYSPKTWFLIHWASFCTTLAGILMLLLARGHYSIDVLIAYYITTTLWWTYHTLANNSNLKGDSENSSNYLSRMWWWYIFRYFEKNVPCNLPRKFSLPLPRVLLRWKPASYLFRRRSLRTANSPSASTGAVASDSQVRTWP